MISLEFIQLLGGADEVDEPIIYIKISAIHIPITSPIMMASLRLRA